MRILITGASGQLGAYLLEILSTSNHEILAWSGSDSGQRVGIEFKPIDLTNQTRLEQALDEADPDAILHIAAISAAESVRLDPVRSRATNVDTTRQIAEWADRHSRRLVFTSTDLVFDGSRPWNRETDPATPSLAYGRTKLEAEGAVLAASNGIVARIPLLYGLSKCGKASFFSRAIDKIRERAPQSFFNDEFRTPLHYGVAARTLIQLLDANLTGLYHLAGIERVSRFELMTRAVRALGLDESLVEASRLADQTFPEPRPLDVSLDSSKLARELPSWDRPTIEESLRSA